MSANEGSLRVDDVVDASICVEERLGVRKDDHGSVGAGAAWMLATCMYMTRRRCVPNGSVAPGDTDGVVESQTKRLVRLLATLAAIEQVRLDVLEDGEEHTARFVSRDVAVGAGNALGDGG